MIVQRLMAIALVSGALAGCSVGMALSGDETPDLSVVKIGAARDDVQLQLGEPERVTDLDGGGQEVAYLFEVGNDPNAIRAIGHGALDVASIGLWEFIGTPIEASTGKERELAVTYDELGTVTKIQRIK